MIFPHFLIFFPFICFSPFLTFFLTSLIFLLFLFFTLVVLFFLFLCIIVITLFSVLIFRIFLYSSLFWLWLLVFCTVCTFITRLVCLIDFLYPFLSSGFVLLKSFYETWCARFKFVLMLHVASYALVKHLTLYTECRFSASCLDDQCYVLNRVVQKTFKKPPLILCGVVQLRLAVSRQLTTKECARFIKDAWKLSCCTTYSITFSPEEFVKFCLYSLFFLLKLTH